MTTIRSIPVKSPLSEIFSREIYELDTNAEIAVGGFTKPLSKLFESAVEAIAAAAVIFSTPVVDSFGKKQHERPVGDMLVKPVDTGARKGWQVFERPDRKGADDPRTLPIDRPQG